jgi:hypothetical protein
MKTAMFMGASDLAQEMKQRQRLGAGRKPNRFLLGQGPHSAPDSGGNREYQVS